MSIPIVFSIFKSAVVDDKTAAMLKSQLFIPLTITQAVQYSLIAVGGFVCVVVILFLLSKSQESQVMTGVPFVFDRQSHDSFIYLCILKVFLAIMKNM